MATLETCEEPCSPNAAQPIPGIQQPCVGCPDGSSGSGGADVEQLVLCDIDANGEVVGTAIAVYEYDSSGNPAGPPTFINPTTGAPYVVQGTLQPCPEATQCAAPLQFCFTTTTTGPVDHPGRMYNIDLPINPGFAVQSLTVDSVTSAANIVWNVDDPDGEKFRAALTTFMEGRLPAPAVVTITNPNAGVAQVCGAAQPFHIHIECLRLDSNPPNLIELLYNGGRDMIQNPAYNESPALNPPVSQGNYGYHLLARQDDPGPFPGNPPSGRALCTSTANTGWETNDIGRTFEIWGKDVAGGVTPTPRGTPVQEVTSDGPPAGQRSTIWQTFTAPASADFKIRLVHGGRDAGENHRITLTPGDTDATQGAGAIIDDITNPLPVYGNPWTQFNQTIPLVGGQQYTLAFSTNNPVGGARGGLFTDMRAYIDLPDQRATATTDDDTCVVQTTETTTTEDCQLWAPSCVNGDIISWRRLDNGTVLSNTAFWGQVPAPKCCLPKSETGAGGSATAGNLIYNYEICGVVGGVRQTLNRVVITDQSGGGIVQMILGEDGAPVTPDAGWSIGACQQANDNPTNTPVCVDPGGTQHIEPWVAIYSGASSTNLLGYRDSQGAFHATLPAGHTLVPCETPGNDTELTTELGCAANVPYTRLTTRVYNNLGTQQGADNVVYLDSAGATVAPPVGFTLGPCKPTAQPQFDHDLLCEPNPSTVRVLVVTSYAEDGTPSVTAYNFPTLTPYAGDLSLLVECQDAQPDPNAVEIDQYDTTPTSICFATGPGAITQWYTYERVLFNNTAPGTEVSRTRHWYNPLTGGDQTTIPAGTAVPCDAGVQVVESEEMGCAMGVPWSRRRTGFFDANGQLITTVYNFVDSNGVEQPTAPAGFTLGDCPAATTLRDVEVVMEPGCAAGVSYTRRTTLSYNGVTGASAGAPVVEYLNSAGAVVAAPAGFTLGPCCCPVALGEVCWVNGPNSGRAFAVLNPTTGVVTYTDLAGAGTIPAAQIVACADEQAPTTINGVVSRIEAVAAGTVAAGKQSATFTNVSTNTGATVGGVPLAPGESVTFTGYYDDAQRRYVRLPAINYVGTATSIIHIATID